MQRSRTTSAETEFLRRRRRWGRCVRRSIFLSEEEEDEELIPVIGYLDDVVIVPAGILLAVNLVPKDLMREFRTAASASEGERVLGNVGAAVIILLWVLVF